MNKTMEFKCSFCGEKSCCSEDKMNLPEYCPMLMEEELIEKSQNLYLGKKDLHSLALASARIESEGYCRWTRIEETINLAKRMKIKRIGIAHCEGFMKEARIVHQIFESHGFEVCSVCCKVGRLDKEKLGLKDDEKIRPGQFESACNPILQAKLLEKAGCEMNIVMGLCVGHDSLFFMHSKVPTTVLVVKDRVLGHNPVAALYTNHTYYRHLKK